MTRRWCGWWSSLSLAVILLSLFSARSISQSIPILLVHGFQPVPGFRATQLWEEFAEYLSGNDIVNVHTFELSSDHDFFHLSAANNERRDVFISNYALSYEPTTRGIFFYTQRFSNEIAFMKEELGVQTVAVVGYSMGGLIARTYIEVGDFESVLGSDDFPDYGIVYCGEIETLVLVATPNHGTLIASIAEWFSPLARQLAPASEYLELLNSVQWIDGRLSALNPSVRYVSMAGQTCLGCGLRIDEDTCLQSCVDEGLAWNGSDFVTMMTSAYLPDAENCALIGFDHVQSRSETGIAAVIEEVLAGTQLPVAIYAPKLQAFQPD